MDCFTGRVSKKRLKRRFNARQIHRKSQRGLTHPSQPDPKDGRQPSKKRYDLKIRIQLLSITVINSGSCRSKGKAWVKFLHSYYTQHFLLLRSLCSHLRSLRTSVKTLNPGKYFESHGWKSLRDFIDFLFSELSQVTLRDFTKAGNKTSLLCTNTAVTDFLTLARSIWDMNILSLKWA